MKAKTMAMVAGAAALVWWLSKGGGLKGLLGLGEDIFGEDLTAAGVPYDPVSQTIGTTASTIDPTTGLPYTYPYSPYTYGSPYSTVSPLGPTYSTPYSPYTGGYPYGATPYTGYPYGSPYGSSPYLPQSTYATPYTTYPSIGGSSNTLLQEIEQLYGGGSAYGSSFPSLFGSTATSTESAANQLKDSYISYGLQSGILQVTFCPQIPIPGGSQYQGCTFSWTTSTGKMKTGNYASAASAMKRYQTTGKLN